MQINLLSCLPHLLSCLSFGILSLFISLPLFPLPCFSTPWSQSSSKLFSSAAADASRESLRSVNCHQRSHADTDRSVWQSVRSFWHLLGSSLIIPQTIISQSFLSVVQSHGGQTASSSTFQRLAGRRYTEKSNKQNMYRQEFALFLVKKCNIQTAARFFDFNDSFREAEA